VGARDEGIVERRDPDCGPETVEHVGQAVGRQNRRAIHHVEVKVRPGGAAAVAQQSERVARAYPVAALDAQAARLEVRVEGVSRRTVIRGGA
jgi:hypothetical protein